MWCNTSINRKLTAIIMLTGAVPLVVACGVLLFYVSHALRAEVEQEIATLADLTGTNARAALAFGDRKVGEAMLAALRTNRHIRRAAVYGKDGRLFVSFVAPGCGSVPAHAPPSSPYATDGVIQILKPITLDGEPVGTVFVEAGLGQVHERLFRFSKLVAAAAAIALFIAFILATQLKRLISRPILNLARLASRISISKDYSIRVPKYSQDEIGVLVDSFNELLSRMDGHTRDLLTLNAALRQSEDRFRAIFNGAPIGITLLAAGGRILEANRAQQEMLGFSGDDLRTFRYHDLAFSPNEGTHRLQDLVAGRPVHHPIETRLSTRDGRSIWVKVTASPLQLRQGDSLVVAMMEDITAAKDLGDQLRHSQKMEAVGRLAGGIAHDFNNLLTVIKGYSELLLKRAGGGHPTGKYLGHIKRAADRAARLVDQLLTFSRRQIAQPCILDLNVVAAEVENMIRPLIGEDIELKTCLHPAPLLVRADRGQLEQVVMNLAVNARDAMPSGGALRIELGVDQCVDKGIGPPTGSGRMSFATLTVRDSGTGMTEGVQSRIFEPFYTTKETGKGTGLGLSAVYGIVMQAGGSVTVDSQPGSGSTFTIYLPRIDQDLPDAPQEAGVIARRGKETILVAEDEDLVRAMVCETLTAYGYCVLVARSGSEALTLAQDRIGGVDLVLTDVIMPQMNGPALADKLRTLRPDLKILYMSGYTDRDLELDAVVLRKPFSPESLAAAVRLVFDGPLDPNYLDDIVYRGEVTAGPDDITDPAGPARTPARAPSEPAGDSAA